MTQVVYVIYNLERSGRLLNNWHYVYSELVSDVLFQRSRARLYIMYAAIRKHGVPEVLVSDSGGVFRSHAAMRIYEALGIQKVEIEKRQAWQSYIESNLYVMWNLENSLHNLHYVDLTLDSYGVSKSNEWQFHIIPRCR
jgi:hypothetical protein